MGLIGAWPNKWLVYPRFETFLAPFTFAEQTLFEFWTFRNGQYIWREITPMVTPNIESFMIITINNYAVGGLVYVSQFRFVGPFSSLLSSGVAVNVSHTPEGETFMGQTTRRRITVNTILPPKPGLNIIADATAGWTERDCTPGTLSQ